MASWPSGVGGMVRGCLSCGSSRCIQGIDRRPCQSPGPVSMPGPGLCRQPAVSERDASDLADRRTAYAAGHPERLVLDLSGLAFVDVAGARRWIRPTNSCKPGARSSSGRRASRRARFQSHRSGRPVLAPRRGQGRPPGSDKAAIALRLLTAPGFSFQGRVAFRSSQTTPATAPRAQTASKGPNKKRTKADDI